VKKLTEGYKVDICSECWMPSKIKELESPVWVSLQVGRQNDIIKRLTEALERILGLCGGRNICPCGRPTGIPAIVSCIQTMLGGKK
jgi:hypothetical protein